MENTDTKKTVAIAAEKPAGFNSAAEFVIVLKREKLTVTVRYPTDEEWAQRQRGVLTVIHRMSGGSSQTKTTGMEEADALLLAKIRVDGGDEELAEGLACLIISRLNKAEAEDAPETIAEGYRIPLRVITGMTVHELRVPTEKEKRAYQRAAYAFIDRRHGRQELRTSLTAICDFYDKLTLRSEGYLPGSAIPAPHKLSAVSELMGQIDAEEDEADPANFS